MTILTMQTRTKILYNIRKHKTTQTIQRNAIHIRNNKINLLKFETRQNVQSNTINANINGTTW